MNRPEPEAVRSSSEIRKSLDANRKQIEEDLDALGHRLRARMNPIRQLGRHPILIAMAGAVFGFLLVKRPALLMRVVGRVARWSTPLVLSAFLKSHAPPDETATSKDATAPTPTRS